VVIGNLKFPDHLYSVKNKNKHMQLFQILGSVVLLGVGGYFVYNAMKNSYIETVTDRRGVTRKRDIRSGRFVKAN
jgi:putative Mn2+ efflux pump MntP